MPSSPPSGSSRTRSLLSRSRHLSAAALALAIGVSVAVAGAVTTPAEAASTTSIGRTWVSGWKLDVNDNFDSLDTRRWSVKDRVANRNEESYLLSRNVRVSNGILRIQGKQEYWGGRKYTSGYVHSRRKYSMPNYFRVEIRAKLPLELGMWAAPMWFRPDNGSGGEIDLLETYGHDIQKFGEYRFHHTIHNAYGRGHQTNQKQGRLPGDPRGWHTYVIEKTRGKIEMFVDGSRTGTWRQGDPSWFNTYFEAGKRWAMIMNLQIGGHRGSPTWQTNWSGDRTTLQVDYVRTWHQG